MSVTSAASHRVAIVGGGFAGLHAARRLGRLGFDVTLLDKRNFHLFQPLLYQVATGLLSPGNIAVPQRVVLRRYPKVRCLTGTAYDLDPARRLLRHEFGELEYDSLIVATGVKHHYFGNDHWREFAPGLKTVEHAIEIRRKLFRAFERAEQEDDPVVRRSLMNFVIVGGGPTGVELAGAIGELCHKTMLRDFRRIRSSDARVVLIEGAAGVLPVYPEKLQRSARRQLEALGVEVLTDTRVTDIDAEGVRFLQNDQEQRLDARTVLWAAGVRASHFGEVLAERTGVELDRGGRVRVSPDCSLVRHPEIFVVGDLGRLTDARGTDVPGLAPAAIQQGEYVARVIDQRVKDRPPPGPFRYKDRGILATIGRGKAVAHLKFMNLTGFIAWCIWGAIHLVPLVGFRNRLVVAVDWLWSYITSDRGVRLITNDQTTNSGRIN